MGGGSMGKIMVCLDKSGVLCVRSDMPDMTYEVFDMSKLKREGMLQIEIEAEWDMRVPNYPHQVKEV